MWLTCMHSHLRKHVLLGVNDLPELGDLLVREQHVVLGEMPLCRTRDRLLVLLTPGGAWVSDDSASKRGGVTAGHEADGEKPAAAVSGMSV
jgi:hypothetical protein